MLVLVMTYKKNGKWNPTYYESKKRFEEMGYTVEPVEGFNLKKHPDIKPNEVVYRNLMDKVIPYYENLTENKNKNKNNNLPETLKALLKSHPGILVAEDDAYVSDILTPAFLLEKLKKNNYKSKIIRVGYQKVLKHPKEGYPREYFCVGNQLIWYPKSQIKKLLSELRKKNPQHLNGFLSKNTELDITLLDEDKQIKSGQKYVYELEHMSATTKKIRKGLKLSKKKKNNNL